MMDREALAAALAYARSAPGFVDWAFIKTLADAADKTLAQLPETCGTCGGDGKVVCTTGVHTLGGFCSNPQPCPSCLGRGTVYKAETVELISFEFASALMPVSGAMTAGAFVALCNAHAVAVLDALNSKDNE